MICIATFELTDYVRFTFFSAQYGSQSQTERRCRVKLDIYEEEGRSDTQSFRRITISRCLPLPINFVCLKR